MKKFLIAIAALLLAVPAIAADVEVIGGAGVGHEIGRPAGKSFNVAWFGPTAKSWNDGDTKLRTLLLYGNYEEASLAALGGEAILSDVLWKQSDWPHEAAVVFAVGFMDQYHLAKDGERDVAPKVGGGLSIQMTKVIWADVFYTAFYAGPQWKQVLFLGLHTGVEFSIGGK